MRTVVPFDWVMIHNPLTSHCRQAPSAANAGVAKDAASASAQESRESRANLFMGKPSKIAIGVNADIGSGLLRCIGCGLAAAGRMSRPLRRALPFQAGCRRRLRGNANFKGVH